MKTNLHVIILIVCLLYGTTAWSQKTVDDWQKKAVTEFPDIGVKDSELNLKYIDAVQSLRVSNPTFFNDPKWPYALAIQVTKKSIIPGLDSVTPVARTRPMGSDARMTPNTRHINTPNGGNQDVEVVPSENMATDGVAGQLANVEGVVTKIIEPGLSTSDRFYVQLKPDVLCEFMIAPFFTRSGSGLGSLRGRMQSNLGSMKLRFESGAIFVDETRAYGRYISRQKLGGIFKPGEKVIINGRYEEKGSVGVTKGKMLRDCSVVNR